MYEYFLGRFAGSEGKRGGEFYTPRSVVRTREDITHTFASAHHLCDSTCPSVQRTFRSTPALKYLICLLKDL